MATSERLLLSSLVVLIGCGTVIQTGINGNLGEATGSIIFAGAVNFGVATVVLAVVSLAIFLIGAPPPTNTNVMPWRWVELTGGLCGAAAGLAIWGVAPHVGYSVAYVVLLVGQLGGGLTMDHWGVMGIPRRSVTWRKVGGVTIVVTGGFMGVLAREQEPTSVSVSASAPSSLEAGVWRTAGLCVILILGGVLMPLQACVNARLNRRFVAVPTTGSLVSYAVGSVALVIACVWNWSWNWNGPSLLPNNLHWWHACGGLFGASFVTGAMILSPLLGVSVFVSCIVCGQFLFSLTCDTLGAFGFERLPFSFERALGVLLAFGGSFLVFQQPPPTITTDDGDSNGTYQPIGEACVHQKCANGNNKVGKGPRAPFPKNLNESEP